jgi:hypothetical protein
VLPVPPVRLPASRTDEEPRGPGQGGDRDDDTRALLARLVGEPDPRATLHLDEQLALLDPLRESPGDGDRAPRCEGPWLDDQPVRRAGRSGEEDGEERERREPHGAGATIGLQARPGKPSSWHAKPDGSETVGVIARDPPDADGSGRARYRLAA